MHDSSTNSLLNDLLVEVHRSLIQYAAEAWPWSTEQARELIATVQHVANVQNHDVSQLVALLKERGHYIDFGIYPPEYTSLHYVAIEFLFTQLVANQKDVVQFLEASLPALRHDPAASSVVESIVKAEKEALQKLQGVKLPGGTNAVAWMK